MFETNLQSLVVACNGHLDAGFFGTLVGDCVYLLKHTNSVQVKFVYTSANIVAHTLAKTAYSMSDVGEWYITSHIINHVPDI